MKPWDSAALLRFEDTYNMSWVVDLFASSGFGAVLGGIGGMAGKVINLKSEIALAKENNRHIEKMHEYQRQSDNAKAQAELWIEDLKGGLENVGRAIEAEQALGEGVSEEVADKRALFRMRATIWVWVLTLITLAGGVGFEVTADPMFVKVMNMQVLVASAAILFWFGGKAVSSRHN